MRRVPAVAAESSSTVVSRSHESGGIAMKVTCHPKREPTNWPNQACRSFAWKKSLPFLVNPRAYLVHRVRAASSHVFNGEHRHDTADYWCGNIGRGEFVAEPPEGSLLCAACEAAARCRISSSGPTARKGKRAGN